MRPRLRLASALGFLLAPGIAHAQTVEIQQEVEAKLWIRWVLARIEAATGAPPFVSILALVAIVITLVASVWLWRSRRKTAG
jgi:hypothetical protein